MTRQLHASIRRRRERGQVLPFIGIAMLAFIALAVVGVDAARLAFTAAEVQSIADAAATAAAGSLSKHDPDPLAVATTVVQQNYVDARVGAVGSAVTDFVKSITPGVWDFTTSSFTVTAWNDPLANAVRAIASARVDNLVAGAIGMLQSDVERHAIAAFSGACEEVVSLPIAIEQDAIQQFMDSADCRSIPVTQLFQVPVDNACFTSLSTTAAGAAEEKAHIPSACVGQGNGNVGGGQTESLGLGEPIALNTGQDNTVLKTIQGCLDANPPLNEFVVPVIAANSCCGGCQQNVVSFARIIIDHVVDQGAASEKGVFIKGVCREEVTGSSPGCTTGGENAIALIQ